MDYFAYRAGILHCEEVAVSDLADRYGTPVFIYSLAALLNHLGNIQRAFEQVEPLICYSLKANPNLSICRLLHAAGAGFDVTSGGELYRAIQAGAKGDEIVFAGVGKNENEIRCGLERGVLLFNIESEEELEVLAGIAGDLNHGVEVALRVNPDLPPKTHIKTDTSLKGTKFGLDIETILEASAHFVNHPHIRISGLHMHLGSPIYSAEPYQRGAEKGTKLIEQMRAQGHRIRYLNMGGGFGIDYRRKESPPTEAFAEAIIPAVRQTKCRLILEPGRFIVGNAGILVSRVLYTKDSGGKHFIVQDAGMNDLIRPALYDAFHRIWPVSTQVLPEDFEASIPGTMESEVVGPVCETGDYLAKDCRLPPLKRADLLATFSAGAYGMAMSSNYNSRLRAAEVMVDGRSHGLIRRRETYADLVGTETGLPEKH
jgi:diaminopimelate decarboxylase